MSRYISKTEIERLRNIELTRALDLLGLHWKVDHDFDPIKNPQTKRIYAVYGLDRELILTGQQWFDVAAKIGRGGAIDLISHLLNISFHEAAWRLREAVLAVQRAGVQPDAASFVNRPEIAALAARMRVAR